MNISELNKGDLFTYQNDSDNVWQYNGTQWRKGLKHQVSYVRGAMAESERWKGKDLTKAVFASPAASRKVVKL